MIAAYARREKDMSAPKHKKAPAAGSQRRNTYENRICDKLLYSYYAARSRESRTSLCTAKEEVPP